MSRCEQGSHWASFVTCLYRPSLLVGLSGYIFCRHRASYIGSIWSPNLWLSMWSGSQYVYLPIYLSGRYIYIYIYIYIYRSSSSCRAVSMDITEPLSTAVSIVHRFWEVFQVTSCIGTELLYIGSCWSSSFFSSMWRGPLEFIAYEFVLTSSAVSCKSGLSNLDCFRDGC